MSAEIHENNRYSATTRGDKWGDRKTGQIIYLFRNRYMIEKSGAAGEIRTLDLPLTKGVLYP